MRIAVLLFLTVAVTACAGTGGAWPSLAPRSIEKTVASGMDASIIVASTAQSLPPSHSPPPQPMSTSPTSDLTRQLLPPRVPSPDIADVAARLSTIERDRTDLAARITSQLAATRSATAARGTKTEGDAWSKAQLETTRLERLGSQVSDLYDRLDVIAGTLAEAGANGAEVAGPLKTTGQAIGRVRALEAEVSAGLAAADSAKH